MDAESGKKFSTINPANGEVIAQISEGDEVLPKFVSFFIKSNLRFKERKNF